MLADPVNYTGAPTGYTFRGADLCLTLSFIPFCEFKWHTWYQLNVSAHTVFDL